MELAEEGRQKWMGNPIKAEGKRVFIDNSA